MKLLQLYHKMRAPRETNRQGVKKKKICSVLYDQTVELFIIEMKMHVLGMEKNDDSDTTTKLRENTKRVNEPTPSAD